MLPAGVTLPTEADLILISGTLAARGDFDNIDPAMLGTHVIGYWAFAQLDMILHEWSINNGVNTSGNNNGLGLVAVFPGQQTYYWERNGADYHAIFVFNDNTHANNGAGGHPAEDRYEGLSAAPQPELSDADVVAIDQDMYDSDDSDGDMSI